MLTVIYRGRPIVYVACGQAHLASSVDALEADHPVRRWAMCMGYFALSICDGTIRGSYAPARAEHFARCALIPEAEFASLETYSDVILAEHFGVPVEQIDERRRDLAVARAVRAGLRDR
ncbi:MAG: hypothetical protein JWO74_2166 [Solirubrobacterales bacterium]|nr:hypothetical protein [Solirubrobacterales bacterium]